MKRRNFISRGVAGLAGAVALSNTACGKKEDQTAGGENKRKLIYRTLGKTGIRLPIVSMGTMDVTSESLMKTALDAGIAHIATAKYYGRGRVEQFVGKVIKHYQRRDIILATGIIPHPIDYKSGLFDPDTDTVKFEADFDESLKQMGVDYVDILYLPFCARKESVMFEPLMKVLEKIKKSGRARFLGVSTHMYVPEAVRAAADSGFYDVVMLAYNFQIEDIAERKAAVNYAAGKGLGTVAMKTITGESWKKTNKQVPVSNPGAALKWVLQNPNIHTTVPGITSFDQLETNLSLMEDLSLTSEEKQYLETARLNSGESLFCQGCGSCLKQCSKAPDIPTLMRSHMYVYGYRDLAAAARNLESVSEASVACGSCTSCSVKCARGFDIRARVMDVLRLKNVPAEFIS